jgi:hypothetical protein
VGNANSGSKREKHVRDALVLAASRVVEGDPLGRKALQLAANRVVAAAVAGDLAAFKEMADRIDGKAPQSVDVTTTHERSLTELSEAALEAILARASEEVRAAAEETSH